MATKNFNGNAPKVTDVWNGTLGGTIAINDTFDVVCSDKVFRHTATTTNVATERTNLIAAYTAFMALGNTPELNEVTAAASATAGVVTFTARVAGNPVGLSVAKSSAAGTWTITNTTPATGPTFYDNPANYVENAIPSGGDTLNIADTSLTISDGLGQAGTTLAVVNMSATMRSQIGRPKVNPNGYAEYRKTNLELGITVLNVGIGSTGSGSPFIRIDGGSVQSTVNVTVTGPAAADGTPAFIWKGTHADNAVNVNGGSVGIGYYLGDLATVKTLRVGFRSTPSDTTVEIGSAVTLDGTGSAFTQSGGTVRSLSAFLAITKYGGDLFLNAGGAGAVQNLGGLFRFESDTGTIASVVNGGQFRRLSKTTGVTVTAQVSMLSDSEWEDANGSITLTAGWVPTNCRAKNIRLLDFGPGRAA